MPPSFKRAYHHYGSLSWQSAGDAEMPWRVRVKQLAKRARVVASLWRARRFEH
jgi:hypothetical protein